MSKAPLTWTAAVVVALAVGCRQAPATEDNVRKALEQANIPSVEVAVDDNENIVHLKGVVETMADRTRAQEVASAAVGTSGEVLNELLVAGLNDRNASDFDGRIQDALDRMLDADAVLKERDVNFEVHNGMVAIKGEVRTAEEKNRVGRIAKAAPGVKDVANGLEVKPE
jgi:osmotically-inducible protein OsmY